MEGFELKLRYNSWLLEVEGSALCASRALIQKSGEVCPLPRAHSAEMEAKMGGKAEDGALTNEADRSLIRRVMGQMKKMNSQAEGMRRHGSGDMTSSADRLEKHVCVALSCKLVK